jgi:hypothetical protein
MVTTYSCKEVVRILKVTESQLKNVLRVKLRSNRQSQLYRPELGNPGSGNELKLTNQDLIRLKRYFDAVKEYKTAKANLRNTFF